MDSRIYTASDKFLGSTHIDGETALTIKLVDEAELRDGNQKLCLHWESDHLAWLLNKTNIRRLQALFGTDTDDWIGKTVTIYHDPDVEYMGNVVGGLRVRTEKKAR